MKNCLLLLIFLCACNNKHDNKNYNVLASIQPLTIEDLKFPIVDEDNGRALLPNPYKQNLIKNHISERISISEPGDINGYDQKVIQQYEKETKINAQGFHDWAIERFVLSDTNFYDEKGNNTRYNQKPVFEGTYLIYKYDSLGFLTKIFGGMRVDDTIMNVFDPIKKILYCIEWNNNKYIPKNNSSQKDLLISITTRYYFNPAGFLIKIIHKGKGYCRIRRFEYNAQDQVVLFYDRLYTKSGSEIDKLTDPKYNLCPVPNERISKYFYHADSIDSIITFNVFYKDRKYNYTRKTYFDSTGLPCKTVNEKEGNFRPQTVTYKFLALN